jgi:tripartite-type tricarboxylate transporter receptor subunit TctC
MSTRILLTLALVLLVVAGLHSSAYPQSKNYPNKAVEILVPLPPGGGVDLFNRLLAEELKKIWNVPVIIINKPGGGGTIAASEVAHANKDGYTLISLLVTQLVSVTVANPEGPINLLRDFDAVAVNYRHSPSFMATRSDSKFKSLKDIIDYARKNPGAPNMGTPPVGTNSYLEIVLLEREAKIKYTIIPFRGTGELIPNLLGGHIDTMDASDVSVKPHIEAGKMRGVVTDTRSNLFPQVPTFAEEGYPEIDLIPSVGIFGPKGLPEEVIHAWEDALKLIFGKPEFIASMKKPGIGMHLILGAKGLDDFLRKEVKKYSRFTPEELGWAKTK